MKRHVWLIAGVCAAFLLAGSVWLSRPAPSDAINDTALYLAWPDATHGLEPKTVYRDALSSTGIIEFGDSCSKDGNSCDSFVATVLRYSRVDPAVPCCGAAKLHSYLDGNPVLYQSIPNTGDESGLQPGDILSNDGHTMIYVRRPDGTYGNASASHCDRTADYAGDIYFSDGDGQFDIYRVG